MSELGAAFRIMMEMPSWKMVEEMIEKIKIESVADEDRVSTAELNVSIIAECRGVRKGLNTLTRRIKEMTE